MTHNWFLQNLLYGFKRCLFLPCETSKINASWHALVSIIILFVFTHWFSDAIIIGQTGHFDRDSSWYYFHLCLMALVLLGSYSITALNKDTSKVIKISVIFYNCYYFISLPYNALDTYKPDWYGGDTYDAIDNLVLIWVFLITFRIIAETLETKISTHLAGALIMVGAIYALHTQVYLGHFYYGYNNEAEEETEFPEYEALTSEELFNNQTDLLQSQLSKFTPSKSGTTDIYGVSFGSYAYQDVFMREARYITERMIDILGIDKGIITLINNPETALDTPLANTTNLKKSLIHIGKSMQTDEDILLLYLTSHGGKESGLSVDLDYRHSMLDINAEQLAEALQASKIKNKVIIISACHSGAFIPFLEDDNTMIITASADNKQSYGCSDDAELTYFAQAYFKEALSETTDLEQAFHLAKQKIEKREKDEGLEKISDPQIFIGKSIKQTLKRYKPHNLVIEQVNKDTIDDK